MKTLLFIAISGLTFAADLDARAAFAKIKSMVGEWQADTSMGKVHLTIELIGGAVMERETFEKMAPMVTVYHLDNGKLMLTHYCHAGNQPRMRASAFDPATGDLRFDFLDITNLANPKAGHMHNARMRIEPSVIQSEWDYWEGGVKKSAESFRYVRIR